MFDFKFGSSFDSDGDLNGFDVYIMNSQEVADQIIIDAKNAIDDNKYLNLPLAISIDDYDLTYLDKQRIHKEIERYAEIRGVDIRFK